MHCRHCTDIVIVAADVGVEYHFGDGLALAEANAKPINNPSIHDSYSLSFVVTFH